MYSLDFQSKLWAKHVLRAALRSHLNLLHFCITLTTGSENFVGGEEIVSRLYRLWQKRYFPMILDSVMDFLRCGKKALSTKKFQIIFLHLYYSCFSSSAFSLFPSCSSSEVTPLHLDILLHFTAFHFLPQLSTLSTLLPFLFNHWYPSLLIVVLVISWAFFLFCLHPLFASDRSQKSWVACPCWAFGSFHFPSHISLLISALRYSASWT